MGKANPSVWDTYGGVVPYAVIKERLCGIRNLRDAGALSVMYGTGCRVGELVKIRKHDVSRVVSPEGKAFLQIRFLANKTRKKNYFKTSLIPLEAVKNIPSEDWLVGIIEGYLSVSEDFPFAYSPRLMEKLANKHFGCNAHLLRHSRITHFNSWGVPLSLIFRRFWITLSSSTVSRYLHTNPFSGWE